MIFQKYSFHPCRMNPVFQKSKDNLGKAMLASNEKRAMYEQKVKS
jgi:hypothetical protein